MTLYVVTATPTDHESPVVDCCTHPDRQRQKFDHRMLYLSWLHSVCENPQTVCQEGCCCCSYVVGRRTRRTAHSHSAASSRMFFPLHILFSPRSCHRLSTAGQHISMLFFSRENIVLLSRRSQNHAVTSTFPLAVLREFPMLNCLPNAMHGHNINLSV